MAGRSPTLLLRIEGLAVLVATVVVYAQQDFSWLVFSLLLFTVDLFMIGYIHSAKLGALTYNIGHSYALPLLLATGYFVIPDVSELVLQLSLIWFSHIGLDRLLGYGLKYSDDFKHTHLGRIGRNND